MVMQNTSSNWIKIEKLKRNLSQAKLAKVLCIDQARLSSWETKKKTILPEAENQIKDFFLKFDSLSTSEKGVVLQRRKYSQERYDTPHFFWKAS